MPDITDMSELTSVIAHLVAMRGIYKTAQLHFKSGIWFIENQAEQEIFMITTEQTPEVVLQFIQTEHIKQFTAYHFCTSENAMRQMKLVYSKTASVRFQEFFLMRKTLNSALDTNTTSVILKKHFEPLTIINSNALPIAPWKSGSDLYAILEHKKMLSWARNSQGTEGSSWISDVNTQHKARKQGLATAIMQRIHSDAAKQGNSKVFLGVFKENIRFYEKMGYDITLHGVRLINHRSIWQRLVARVTKFLKR
jgi:predicted GNAT family acetyltransferase